MSWFIKFIDSSVGKKLIMALTGLFASLFLVIHLIGNLTLLSTTAGTGEHRYINTSFETYSEIMASNYNIPIRIIEILLFILLIYHTINGIRLFFINKKARSVGYTKNDPSENSSFFSRIMPHTGVVILVFLVLHIIRFFIPYRYPTRPGTLEAVVETFNNPYYSGFYLFAFLLLCFHLIHGVQSSFQTLGIRHNRYTPIIKGLGVAFAIIICAGFAIIPIYFLVNQNI